MAKRKTKRERELETRTGNLDHRELTLNQRETALNWREEQLLGAQGDLERREKALLSTVAAAREAELRIASIEDRETKVRFSERVAVAVDEHLRAREASWPLSRDRCLSADFASGRNPHAGCHGGSRAVSVEINLSHAQHDVVASVHARGLHGATMEETVQKILDHALVLAPTPGPLERVAGALEERTRQNDGVYPPR